jgi:protein TonB
MRRVLTCAITAALIHPLGLGAQAPPIQAWLGSDTSMPVATFRVLPSFAADSGPATIHGAVEIEAVVDVSGRVAHGRVVTRLAEAYDQASLEALRRWRFRPAQRSGRPAATLIGVRFTFLPPRVPGAASEVNAITGLLPRRPLPAPASPVETVPLNHSELTAPHLVRAINPEYTDAATRRKIQGDVQVEAVIMPDGTVGSARVVRSLDATHGLDEQALIAARYWFLEPGTLNGQPVAVTVRMLLSFRLY